MCFLRIQLVCYSRFLFNNHNLSRALYTGRDIMCMHIFAHTYTIYIYIFINVCVCVYISA